MLKPRLKRYSNIFSRILRTLVRVVAAVAVATLWTAPVSAQAPGAHLPAGADTMSIESLTVRAYTALGPGNVQRPLALYKAGASRYSPSLSERERYFSVIAMVNVGYVYLFYYHNPEQAYPYLARGLKTAKENNFISLVPGALDNLAKVHGDYGDTQTELRMLKEAFELTMREDQGTMYALSQMPVHLRVMVFLDMVMTAVRHNLIGEIAAEVEVMARAPVPGIHLSPYAHRVAVALRLAGRGDHAGALKTLKAAGDMISVCSDYHRYVVNHHLLMSCVSGISGDTTGAIAHLDDARAEALAHGIDDLLPRIHRRKAELMPDSATHYRALAALTRDSLYDVSALVRIKDLENSAYIDQLTWEAAIEEERHRRRIYIIYILAGALLVAGSLGAVVLRRNRQLSEANRTLVRNSRQEADARELDRKLRHAIPVDEQEKLRVAARVRDVLEGDERVFDSDFGLDSLASLTSTKPKYLSSIINEVFGRNLSTLLAEVRVREACRRLSDPATASTLTIDAIAAGVGYRSRTHFSTLFKKITGVSPSRYAAISASEKDKTSASVTEEN